MAFYRALAFALATCVVAEDPRCQADEHVLLQGVMRKVVKTDVERMIEEFEDEGGHSRVAADQPPPIDGFAPGVLGWCRTANGGEAEGVDGAPRHVHDCARQCRASPTCQAFEFSAPRRGRQFPRACKLYNSPMPGPVGEVESDADGYAQCYNTVAAAEAAAELLAAAACEDWAVEYNGMCYAVVDRAHPDSPHNRRSSCDTRTRFYRAPSGYAPVEFSEEVQENVASQHPFGTLRVVYANGETYGTGVDGSCQRCSCGNCNYPNQLVTGENAQYRVRGCHKWKKVFVARQLQVQ